MRLFGLQTCDTCRKARKALESTGNTVEFIDVRAAPLNAETRQRFLAAFGEALINRRSTTWKTLSDDEKAMPPLDLLAHHPTVMKRPVIETEHDLNLGWDAKVQAALLP
ncbi:arsenate reductase family protein [Actibacterium sp. 188UL27-1]|uniref:arsenate reductase family protein n=1 Tax=Actibacterium sp. 188UL27-1 TaxID=2786961 RepID=UPI001958790C|nr:ArsC/Spx/MgsR family protein [Actibacterium sp. 188UL27-1]MBM7069443.1 hypothetical protein [Actibacterium sp. 188UL27-1]